LTAAVAGVFGWIAYQRRMSQERYSAGYAMGFVGHIVRPGVHADFVHLSSQRGYDLGKAEAERLCAEQRDIPSDLQQRAQLFSNLVQSAQHVPSDSRTRIIRQLRLTARLMDGYDDTDIYDHVPASGVGFWCRSCKATLGSDNSDSEEDAIVSYHEQGQAAKELGWLVQETDNGIHMLCPKCRRQPGDAERSALR
jgi:hypothetical protein